MAKHDVKVFSGLGEMSWAAVSTFEDLARLKAIENKTFSAALSGGLTPRLVYQILGSPALAGRIRWNNVQLFQVDERCVPPDHPDSNYRMIREALLDSADIPGENFHRMQAERADLDQAARDYARELGVFSNPKTAPGRAWMWCFWAWDRTGTPRPFFPGLGTR